MGYAILFPGQGSQHVGMGADLFDRRPDLLGDEAEGLLGWSLRELCLEGPEEVLTRTEFAQPALFAISFALWAELAGRVPPPSAAAGHSLGEYTALTAAGAMDYTSGLRLVAARGRAMAAAADATPSGMAALLGIDGDSAETICRRRREAGGRLWVANLNAPGQVVVGGAIADIGWLVDSGRELGVRRVVPLKVAGAFHSPLMAPAAEEVAAALAAETLVAPQFPVWANATAEPHHGTVAPVLVQQMTASVRFEESLRGMARRGVDTFVHVGPGDVTAGMARRSAPGTDAVVVSTLADVEDAAARVIGS